MGNTRLVTGQREPSTVCDFSPEEMKRGIHQMLVLRTETLWNVCPESPASEQRLLHCWAPGEDFSQSQHEQKLRLMGLWKQLEALSRKTTSNSSPRNADGMGDVCAHVCVWKGGVLSGSLFSCGQKKIFSFPENCKYMSSALVIINIQPGHLSFSEN